jgi:membrane fusion protein, multidrug efflux system
VPTSAVVNSTEKIFVVKIRNGKAEWVPVQKGRVANEQAEIFGNLHAGDTIVVDANEEFRDGMPVGKIMLLSDSSATQRK